MNSNRDQSPDSAELGGPAEPAEGLEVTSTADSEPNTTSSTTADSAPSSTPNPASVRGCADIESACKEGPDISEKTHLWVEFFDEAKQRLSAAGFDSAQIDARRIIEAAAGVEPSEFYHCLQTPAMTRGVAHFDSMMARRLTGEPLQYVLGSWSFRYLDLAVDKRVLIPRPETEVVCGFAISEFNWLLAQRSKSQNLSTATAELSASTRVSGPKPSMRVLDLGTGSGCIGLSFLKEIDQRLVELEVVCTDISEDALSVARANAIGLGRLATGFRAFQSRWFEAFCTEQTASFDLIISNPPYVGCEDEIDPQVAKWEPEVALYSPEGGLKDAFEIIAEAPRWLKPDGVLVLELGETHLDEAASFSQQHGFKEVESLNDLAGRPRCLIARKAIRQ